MATILEFRAASKARRSDGGSRATAPAEIVIFPGVRIERWEEAPEQCRQRSAVKAGNAKGARSRRTPRRDTLEILD